MRRSLALALAATLFLPALAWAAAPAAATPGKDRAEAFIATLKKVKKDDGKLTDADKAANAKIFLELDNFLNFDTLTTKPIAPRADKLSAKEMESFKVKFRELIRLIAYPKSGSFFNRATYVYSPEQTKDDLAIASLKIHLADEDLDTVLEMHWKKVGGVLKIEDVLFDGDSLVKDYQNQLSKKIDKSGVSGLMQALDEKLADQNKPAKDKGKK
jgi:ABC-type transporter MlaC component